jgi:hypothetical protein
MKVKNRTPNPNIGIIQDSLTHPTGLLKNHLRAFNPPAGWLNARTIYLVVGLFKKLPVITTPPCPSG